MKRLWPYGLLLILVVGFFWQFTFTGKIPIDSTALYQMRPWSRWQGNPYDPSAYDTARYYHNIDPVVEVLPVKTWMASYIRQGNVPLWIPSLFSGSPFAANHHAAPWDVSTIFFCCCLAKLRLESHYCFNCSSPELQHFFAAEFLVYLPGLHCLPLPDTCSTTFFSIGLD